ncbi:hypothetical protein HZB00_03110 [Candidatus Woesearchaeota archaeon]|nr:hypothetical protein [Candidatus Woesearchaeota archaeon]
MRDFTIQRRVFRRFRRSMAGYLAAGSLLFSPFVSAQELELELTPATTSAIKVDLPTHKTIRINETETSSDSTIYLGSDVDLNKDGVPEYTLQFTYQIQEPKEDHQLRERRKTLDLFIPSSAETLLHNFKDNGSIEGFGPVRVLNIDDPAYAILPQEEDKPARAVYFFALQYTQYSPLKKTLDFIAVDLNANTLTRFSPKETTFGKITLTPRLYFDVGSRQFKHNGPKAVDLDMITILHDHQAHVKAMIEQYYPTLRYSLEELADTSAGIPAFDSVRTLTMKAATDWRGTRHFPDAPQEETLLDQVASAAVLDAQMYAWDKTTSELTGIIKILPEDYAAISSPPASVYIHAPELDQPTKLELFGRWTVPGYLNPVSEQLYDTAPAQAIGLEALVKGGELAAVSALAYFLLRSTPQTSPLFEERTAQDPLPYGGSK